MKKIGEMKASNQQLATVSPATLNDCDDVIALCEQRHREEDFYVAPFDRAKVEKLIGKLIEMPDGIVLVAKDSKRLVGCVVGCVVERWFSSEKTALPFAFYVLPAYRSGAVQERMFWEFQAQAMERGARMVEAFVVSSPLSSSSIAALEQSGFTAVAQQFVWVPAGLDVTEAKNRGH